MTKTKLVKKTAKKKTVKKVEAKKVVAKKAAKKNTAKLVKAKKPLRTYISFILDYSSSMSSIRAEAIEHFNEQIEKIKSESFGMDTRISLITFNDSVNCIFFNQALDKLKPLTLRTYAPRGNTAMYDAIGSTIDRMVNEFEDLKKDKNTAALVVVISDGQENASKKYSSSDIKERIDALQDSKRWTFSYLGANQDLNKIHTSLNIPVGNISAFVADSSGMQIATAQSVASTSNYLKARSIGETQSMNYYDIKPSK